MSVVDDVFEYLEAEGLAGGSTDWVLIRRRLPDAPDRVVVISEDGGIEPEIPQSAGIGDSALADPAVMVTVRASAWDGDATHEKALEIFSALHGKLDITLVAEAYLRIRAQTPEPVFAGFDDRGRPLHTTSYRMLRAIGVSS